MKKKKMSPEERGERIAKHINKHIEYIQKDEQLDRIERMLKWLIIEAHIDKALMSERIDPAIKEYVKILPDISDILDDVEKK